MANELIYYINGFILGLIVLLIILAVWYLFAAYRELGFMNMWLWPLFSPKKSYKMVKNRMYNQLQKVTFGSTGIQLIFGIFIIIFIFVISLGLCSESQINFLGL